MASRTQLGATVVGLVLLAACGDDDDPAPAAQRPVEAAGSGARRADASAPGASAPTVRTDGVGGRERDAAADTSAFDGGTDAGGDSGLDAGLDASLDGSTDRDAMAMAMPMPIEDANVRAGNGGSGGRGGLGGEGGGAAVGGFEQAR